MTTTTGGAGEFMEFEVTLIKHDGTSFLAFFEQAKKPLTIRAEEEFLGEWKRFTKPEDAQGKHIRVRLNQQRAIHLGLLGDQVYGTKGRSNP